MYLGVAYYPEHWDKQDWERDISLMKEAGLNVVRLAEFAWSQIERTEGRFSFEWLDEVLELLAKHGLKAIMCTPTAAPPPWLTHKHPSILPVDQNGVVMSPGSRRHYCPSSPIYREYAGKIVQEMVDHVRDNDTVVGWQTDNEFGCSNTARCYCDNCRAAFREWLRKRHGSIDALNEAWGTDFWSGVYNDWNEIPVPRKTTDPHHPGLLLDFYRFASDAVVDFQQLQVDIIKRTAPHHFVTHNMIASSQQIDYYDLTKGLDFASWDSYPKPELQPMRSEVRRVALWHDLFRGLKRKNFWLLEQRCSTSRAKGGYATPPAPGLVRLWTYQAIAHGADGIVYFRWRAAKSGAEQCLGGVLSVDGRPTRAYDEIKRIGTELSILAPHLRGTTVPTRAAITASYPIQWAIALQPSLFGPGFSFHQHMSRYHRAFFDAAIPVTIVNPESDLSAYRLVVVPSLFLTNEAIVRNLYQYVEQGGILVVTARSGVKDWSNKAAATGLPGDLADLLKIRVDECDSLLDHGNEIEMAIPGLTADKYTCQTWCELVRPEGASVLARYTQGHFAGAAAITEASHGKGRALYVGAEIAEERFYSGLIRWLAAEAGVASLLPQAFDDVEVMKRVGPGTELLFLLNYNLHEARTVSIGMRHRSLLNNGVYDDRITLAPGDVEVLSPCQ
ncbi:MAG: beta-galactosidase [Limnochordia bacterium]